MGRPKVNYYLDRRYDKKTKELVTDRNGEVAIFLNVRYLGMFLRIYTGIKCNPKLWDSARQQINANTTEAQVLNGLLTNYKAELQDLWSRTLANKIEYDKQYLSENFSFLKTRDQQKIRKQDPEFFDVFDKFIDEQKTEKGWSPGTLKNFKTFKENLDKFSKECRFKLEFNQLDKTFLTAFMNWHHGNGMYNPHTLKNINLLVWFLEWSNVSGYNQNVNYKTWKPNLPVPGPIDNNYALTDIDLYKLENKKFDNPELDKTRDIFLLMCYTALRYSDIKKLRKDDRVNGNLEIKTKKTRTATKIPLIPESLALLEKYKDYPGELAMPAVSNQQFNSNIKTVCRLAEIDETDEYINYIGNKPEPVKGPKWKFISSKDARKTFVSVAFNHGIPSEITASITGHSSERMAVIYRRISDEKKSLEMQKMSRKKVS
jgi:integrase